MITITVRQVDDVTIVDLVGMIIFCYGTDNTLDAIKKLVAEGKRKVVLNLAGVSRIDSCGIGVLAGGFTKLKDAGGKLKLLSPQPQVAERLRIVGLSTVFETYEDEATAVASFKEGGE